MQLAELRVGNRLDRQEAILWVQKSSQSANGSWFVRGSLEDPSGSINFICFNADTVNKIKELSAAVPIFVSGQVQADRYATDGRLQVLMETAEIMPAGRDVSHLLPVTLKNQEKYKKRFQELVRGISRPPLRDLLQAVFEGKRLERFYRNPAAKRFHHAYIGGLLEHTVDVAELAQAIAGKVDGIDKDMVIAGALLHDIGKIEEISSDIGFGYTETGHLLGHIAAGIVIAQEAARGVQFLSQNDLQSLLHILLSHHGSKEKGSPVNCVTQEAVIVHYADEMNAVLQQFNEGQDRDAGGWSFNRMMGCAIRTNVKEKN